MFVAGGLIWANVFRRTTIFPGEVHGSDAVFVNFGWPFFVHEESYVVGEYSHSKSGIALWDQPWTSYWAIGFNSIIATGLLVGVWLICENIIRRRAARKEI